ncbi:MAG: hypothetical protein ACREUZ_22600, partial [Burkholderiales bacterium]
TSIWLHTRTNPGHLPLSWKILASGYVPQYLYESGRLDSGVPFAELERRAHVNARAQAAGGAVDFSRRIREPAVAQTGHWVSDPSFGWRAHVRTADLAPPPESQSGWPERRAQ